MAALAPRQIQNTLELTIVFIYAGARDRKEARLMAVPKRRKSRANTRSWRARWTASAPELVPIVVNGERMLVPRRLVRHFHREEGR